MTTQPGPDHSRTVRRRRMHERQAVIFGLLVAFLVITGIGALAVYTGAVDAPFNKGFTTIQVDGELADVKSPCLPEGTLPVAYADVQVRVFNGTGKGGLGAANQEILTNRGFTVVLLGDLEDTAGKNITQDATQISYGLAGVAQAYTLAAHYPSPILVLDDRADATVDVVLGKNFENLVDEELVGLDGAVPLESRKDCVAVETLTPRAAYVPPVPAADVPAEEVPAEEAPAEG
ncbi:LytR C-terminal domain-containing protein [Oerskovia sp. NPDC060287]|uniref:LytR C-terminal domain-containing protein n=1 Tax=Oerskovia sp. NPDC060287 TaxID=3347095 RepID=UPI00366929CC